MIEEIEEENVIVMGGVILSLDAQGQPLGSGPSVEAGPVKAGRKAPGLQTIRIADFLICPVRSVEGTRSCFILMRRVLLGIWAVW